MYIQYICHTVCIHMYITLHVSFYFELLIAWVTGSYKVFTIMVNKLGLVMCSVSTVTASELESIVGSLLKGSY